MHYGTRTSKMKARISLEKIKVSIPGSGFTTVKRSKITGRTYGRRH